MTCLKLLLQANPDVNVQGAREETALHRIAQSSWKTPSMIETPIVETFMIQATKMLLAAGADPLIKDNKGFDVIKRAKDKRKFKMVELLNEALQIKLEQIIATPEQQEESTEEPLSKKQRIENQKTIA